MNRFIDLIENGFLDRFNPVHDSVTDDRYDDLCVNPVKSNGQRSDGDRDFRQCCGLGLDRRFYNGAIHSCCHDRVVPIGGC